MSTAKSTETILCSLAGEKLSILNNLNHALHHYVEQDNPSADEITLQFKNIAAQMNRITQIDRAYADIVSGISDPKVQAALSSKSVGHTLDYPQWANLITLLEDQRSLYPRVMEQVHAADEKTKQLSEDCRSGLQAIQQQKWIYAQFADSPLQPGSLLNYSESLHNPYKKRQ